MGAYTGGVDKAGRGRVGASDVCEAGDLLQGRADLRTAERHEPDPLLTGLHLKRMPT